MHWLQWRFCSWLPKTCKVMLYPSIFSKGVSTTERKLIRLEKSANKTLKPSKNEKKKSKKKSLQFASCKGASILIKTIITNITEQRKRKPKHAKKDNQEMCL